MKLATAFLIASLGVIGPRLHAQESPPAESRRQPRVNDERGDTWAKEVKDRAKRGTLHDAFQYVRGDSGKWNDEPILQHAPPIARKPDDIALDNWADQLMEQDFELQPNDDNWLLLRTRQLDDNDRVWIERIERRGNHFTVVVNEAIWQGRYQKTFTYYSAFGINLGKLERGQYTATVIIKPLAFKQFDGDGRPNPNWPKDESSAEKKAVELRVAFDVAWKRAAADPLDPIRANDDGTYFVHADATLHTQLAPFLERHCFACHSGDEPEAGLNLRTMATDVADADVRRRWVYLYDRVSAGEMPPKSAEQPDAEAKAKMLHTLAESLTRADAVHREVVLRRLNRREYEHSVRDLFDIEVDVQSILPDDSAEQGFDTIGSALSVSAEQLVAYIEAADVVLDRAFGSATAPRRINQTVNFKDLRSKDTADRVLPDGVVLFSGAKDLPLYGISVSGPATYRLRIQAKAIQTDRPVVMQVNGGVTGRIPGHVAGFFSVPPDKLTTIELTDRAVENSDTFSFGLIGGFPWWSVKEDEYEGAGLFVGDIHIEGPLEEWPPSSRARLLGNVDPANGTLADIRAILSRIMRQAFRRQVNNEEMEPYVALAKQALDEGVSFEAALRRGLKGVICAPEFLFLEEPVVESEQNREPRRIDDFALASRLSFFLWSSLPDAELLALAERGELGRPDVLRAQVERMLADPKSRRFVESFTGQWLRIDDIDFTVPDQNLYPEYNQLLRQSMLDETRAFFRELLDRDLSVRNFIDSDFVMINQPLGDFYGIEGVEGLRMRRVELPGDSLRGGVLTQASVLKVSADGTRTSPVLRGAWILKYFFGAPSPPPPPGVAAVEPDIRGATTIREQLARHREHESCNRCHRKIDPLGFALENFDVIGAQRDWYRTRGGGKYLTIPRHPQAPKHYVQYRQGPDVDASGTTSDGQQFADIREYKQLLLKDDTTLPRALTRLLLAYSLGRHLGFSDRPAVERIVESVESHDYGLRSLIHAMVQSETFRQP